MYLSFVSDDHEDHDDDDNDDNDDDDDDDDDHDRYKWQIEMTDYVFKGGDRSKSSNFLYSMFFV